jgi:hypothetical protein
MIPQHSEPVECLVPLLRDAVEVRVRIREPFGLQIPNALAASTTAPNQSGI